MNATQNFKIILQNENSNRKSEVTVIITLYNYQQYINECLDSVKSQTLSDIDLVIVDDCSKDKSQHYAKRWLEKNGVRFNNYKLVAHIQNSGLAMSRNRGVSLANTDFVFILDADNLLFPRCLERLLMGLKNCDASFAYCYLEEFGSKKGIRNVKQWNPEKLSYENFIDAMVLIRKNVLEKVNNYSILPVMGWEDYDLWFKIARINGWGIQIPEILARYRVHKKSMLSNITNPNVDKLWDYLKKTYPEFFHIK